MQSPKTQKNSHAQRPESRTVLRFNPSPASPTPHEEGARDEQSALATLSDELTAVTRRALKERDQLRGQLETTQRERDHLRGERDEMMRLILRWQQHAARLERYNASLEREMSTERLEQRDALDAERDAHRDATDDLRRERERALHLAQRAVDLAQDTLQSRWISRKRQRHLSERLEALAAPLRDS